MSTNNPNYYGILPATVRYDETISPFAKILYTEITALANKEGFCYASNLYFAKLYKKNNQWVSKVISSLAEAGHVRVEVDREGGNVRRIFPLSAHLPIVEKDNTSRGKTLDPYRGKVQYNSTSINTKSNTLASQSDAADPLASMVNPSIELFEPLNPSFERLYKNTTQRGAMLRLLKKFGVEKIQGLVRALPDIVSQKTAPRITTPLQLEDKLGQLVIFMKQNGTGSGVRGKGKAIIGLDE